MNLLLYSFLVVLLVIKCHATESPETESYTNQSDQNIDVITAYNKTVSELMNEQTEAIRKIISAAHNPEYDPELPKAQEDNNNQKLQEDSIEQLKEKCEQHFKISGNKHNDKFEELSEGSVVKVIAPLAQPINPQLVHPETTSPLLFSLYADNQAFSNKKTEEKPVVTQQSQDQQFSQTQIDQQNQQLYLTKLTPPVISQHPPNFHKDANKPIYLTKVAPVVIPQAYQNHHLHATNENVQTSAATKFKIAGQINPEHFQNHHHLHHITNENVQSSIATTFKIAGQTNPEDSVKTQNFDYVQLEPVWLQKTVLNDGRIFYYWFRKVSQVPAGQALETTAYSANEKVLQPQLKFVLPILPASSEVVSKDQWHFEPHGHYSKIVKSNFRSPTLHMIRALKVPNLSEKGKEEVQAKLDDVSVE